MQAEADVDYDRAMSEPARDLLRFIDASPSPYHAVATARRHLEDAGFMRLDEREAFVIEPGAKVFVVRSGSIAAFVLGTEAPIAAGFHLVGAHTDSPNLRVKPSPDLRAAGCLQIAVEPYGGVLQHTWLDRDLGVAGRVIISGHGGVEERLVFVDRPLLRVPSLAIHLNRNVNTEGLVLNAQRHLPPVIALASAGETSFLELLALELSKGGDTTTAASILGFDLMTTDLQPASLLGAREEFVVAPRLDNLASCHAALTALLADARQPRKRTRGVVLFDHEECGSESAHGAASSFLGDLLRRILAATGATDVDALPRAIARSFFVSADMAHALHPSHLDKHDGGHAPILGEGPVVKLNTNQRYATDGEGWARFESWARDAAVKTQRFVARSDLGCGSTIGPMTAASLGIRTVDVGNPMLSMHSCREVAGTADVAPFAKVLEAFLADDASR